LKFLKKLTFDDLGLSPPKGIDGINNELKEIKLTDRE
jgi:hypothetical protein